MGEFVLTKNLIDSREDLWYIIRVCDIDLRALSFVGQVVFKSQSKQEAVDFWKIGVDDEKGPAFRRSYYIFNPKLERVRE